MKTYIWLFVAGFVVFLFGFIQFNNITPMFMLFGTAIFVIALYEYYIELTKPKKTKKREMK